MNILLIGVMMGLMLVFSHGWGHHKPSSAPEHHATKPEGATTPSAEAPGASRRPGESNREPTPDPKGNREAEPTPAPKAD